MEMRGNRQTVELLALLGLIVVAILVLGMALSTGQRQRGLGLDPSTTPILNVWSSSPTS